MGLLDRAREVIEENIGVSLVPRERVEELENTERRSAIRDAEYEDLAFHVLDYFGNRPGEMRIESRNRLAQQSRVAYMQDPLAFREIEMTGDFTFGRGVSPPRAKDPKVQKIIDEAWTDPNNVQKLTGFDAQRALIVDAKTQANIFFTLFEKNGRIRVGIKWHDLVQEIVTDPEDDLRPLWYVIVERKQPWNFEEHRYDLPEQYTSDAGKPKVKYYEHWQNVEDAKKEREERGEEALDEPADEDLAESKVYHFRMHRWSHSQFGIPAFARTLRFFSAMNRFTETRVIMAEASASFIARRAAKTSARGITRLASQMVDQLGELGAAAQRRDGDGNFPNPLSQPAPPPGTILTENDTVKTEPLSLNSGAGQAATDGQIIRAPIAAASGYGQHYLGDASNANLASATTLELPALLMTAAWQERFEQCFKWFTDRAIEAAVRAGKLGGMDIPDKGDDEETDATSELSENARELNMSEARLWDADDYSAVEERTGMDLGYEFSMPYPLRREMGDVVALVTDIQARFDPNGTNTPLQKALLTFLFTHAMEEDDPGGLVEEIIEKMEADAANYGPPGVDPNDPNADPNADPAANGNGTSSGGEPSSEKRTYGEKRRSQDPEDVSETEWLPAEFQDTVDAHASEVGGRFDSVTATALRQSASMNGKSA